MSLKTICSGVYSLLAVALSQLHKERTFKCGDAYDKSWPTSSARSSSSFCEALNRRIAQPVKLVYLEPIFFVRDHGTIPVGVDLHRNPAVGPDQVVDL